MIVRTAIFILVNISTKAFVRETKALVVVRWLYMLMWYMSGSADSPCKEWDTCFRQHFENQYRPKVAAVFLWTTKNTSVLPQNPSQSRKIQRASQKHKFYRQKSNDHWRKRNSERKFTHNVLRAHFQHALILEAEHRMTRAAALVGKIAI